MAIIGVSGKIGSGKDTIGRIIQYLTADIQYKIPFKIMDADETMIDRWDYLGNWKTKKFADKLKECASIITGIPKKDLEKEEVKNSYLDYRWNKVDLIAIMAYDKDNPICNEKDYIVNKMTVRKFLQLFGTEVGRQIHPDTWVNTLFNDYKLVSVQAAIINYSNDNVQLIGSPYVTEFPKWIITDVRFLNEYDAIKKRGGIIIRVNSNFIDHVNKITRVDFENDHLSETALDNATFDYTIDNNGTIEELVEKVKEILIKEKIL